MTPAALATLHRRVFKTPRPWSEAEFAGFLAEPRCILVTRTQGFALGRVVADEAELLTLAVDPAFWRQGTGRRLLNDFAAQARNRGANRVFLEVAANNHAAIGLYRVSGYGESGRRRGYYLMPNGDRIDAITMDRLLGGA